MARPKGMDTMELVVSDEGKPRQAAGGGSSSSGSGSSSSTVINCCPDRAAAISMLPLADDRISCDSCDKDIKYVSLPSHGGAGRGVGGMARAVGVAAKRKRSSVPAANFHHRPERQPACRAVR